MSMIDYEDILGYRIMKEIICESCISKDEESEAKHEDIITTDWAENQEALIFCDRCKDRIW